ncbi:MAG: hypothetical protein K0M60_21420, partial [Hydrogenophaga sp.]|nr:hypothetical protein [Hydrogenophaga sp.]
AAAKAAGLAVVVTAHPIPRPGQPPGGAHVKPHHPGGGVPPHMVVRINNPAAAFGGKHAAMMKPAAAEKTTGYVVGGISPFGQKKPVPTAIEIDSMAEPLVYMNGGQRGLQVRLSPQDALKALGAIAASLVA